ncbi:oxidoreductase [Cantharellus anzutake]|uniref:oxidoreductase n=1 Tax=Cantharellus anzutake TaxID=1750568 RepID=UPI00190721B5|nr:oxidoreductase [Cantharellus anzutake]KAF8325775.1 oxidoreductase [Cantharellus anzutake]
MTSRARSRIYTLSDVAIHVTKDDCWVVRNGRVYNVSEFVNDHPGGDDLILQWAGKDVGDIMADSVSHGHSQSAYDMLSEYLIGKIGSESTTVNEDWVATEDFHPDETSPEEDFKRHEFLDLSKPLLRQVWESNFSKEFYLQQVHQPRHVTKTARLFGPNFLEMFTRTEWYVVPIFWLPIATAIFFRSALQFAQLAEPSILDTRILSVASIPSSAYLKTLTCFLTGNVIWTVLEYTLHRFLFHIDKFLPDRPFFLMLHFLLHGIHHYLPMDGLRLVMPPILFFALSYPWTQLAHTLFPAAIANGLIAGAFIFYVLYDCMHYALHHKRLPAYMREQKKYHLAHHYKNFDLGFGVTSKIWDHVFGTLLKI